MALITYITPTQPTGSTYGTTCYKNATCIAMRSRSYPVRNRTQAHVVPMDLISQLSIFWEQPLTNADRTAWGAYAYGTPLTNAWGAPRFIRGYAHYMRSNRPRLQHRLPRIDAGPVTTGLPIFTPLGIRISSDQQTISIYFDPTDTWVTQDGAYVMAWLSIPRPPTPARPPEIYSPLGHVAGSSTTPPTSPATFTAPTTRPAGRYTSWVRTSLTLADGRLSI